MVRLQFHEKNRQYVLTIPKAMVEAKKWKRGQELVFVFNERGNLELEEA